MYHDHFDEDFAGDIDVVANTYATMEDDIEEGEVIEDEIAMQNAKAGVDAIPEAVRNFVLNLQRCIRNKSTSDISNMYDGQFNRLTEKFYTKKPWPKPIYIETLTNEGNELYYRHIYSLLQPTIDVRFNSYQNYCLLFNLILNAQTPLDLELPNQWLWDIIDEFIYQYQAFCNYRSNISKKSPEEIESLKSHPDVWNTCSVLNVLYSLIHNAGPKKVSTDEDGTIEIRQPTNLYKMLGYFSHVGLLRVHCLLGDYTLALQALENIELGNPRALYTRVTACHVTVYYYVGFAYQMMRRYADAIRIFVQILTFILRTRQFHPRSYQFDSVNKKGDQMYALLAICVSLSPARIDEHIHIHLREKYGDHQHKMQRGDKEALDVFKELFLYACPKFVCPCEPNYDDPKAPAQEPQKYQANIFLKEVQLQLVVPTLRSFLKLYTAMSLDKLSNFLEMDESDLRTQLLMYKQRSRQVKWIPGSSLLDGEISPATDLDFGIQQNMIYIAESKIGRRYADWFIRNSTKFQDMVNTLEVKQRAAPTNAETTAAA
ncbi:hypothetical protein H4219_002339 [Mycoemilia scoparia]|uniref:Eukaryotic translation initiation factor 3 subunit L n=1 Tax=Mycoemilia scoparia TaxID=417184 RepID=A0A9W7ZXV6_9FUNG|nr:hypothetical protein H4219_002339 [Mycoemilia scoparia]